MQKRVETILGTRSCMSSCLFTVHSGSACLILPIYIATSCDALVSASATSSGEAGLMCSACASQEARQQHERGKRPAGRAQRRARSRLDRAPVAVAAVAGESNVTVSPVMHAPSNAERPWIALAK